MVLPLSIESKIGKCGFPLADISSVHLKIASSLTRKVWEPIFRSSIRKSSLSSRYGRVSCCKHEEETPSDESARLGTLEVRQVSMQKSQLHSPCESSSTIAMLPERPAVPSTAWNVRKFGIVLAAFQIVFVLLFACFVQYDSDALPFSLRSLPHPAPVFPNFSTQTDSHKSLDISAILHHDPRFRDEKYPLRDFFSMYGDIQIMIFLAFGLLLSCFKRYGYSSTGISLVLAAFVVQWATLMHGFLDLQSGHIKLSLITLISADFSIAAVLISTCVLLGTLSPLQYLILAFTEVIFYALNEYVCLHILRVVDVGGSIYLHTFAAYFGLAASVVINRPTGSLSQIRKLACGSKFSELFGMIGTLLLVIYWPSFNSVFAPADLQNRAIINTAISLVASTMGAFATAAIFSKEKFSMTVVQNGVLAGGVAIGSTADLMIQPFAALLIGFSAGGIAVLGFQYMNPILEKKLQLLDMCGVQYLHGLPGVLAGCISALVCGIASHEAYGSSYFHAFPAAAPLGDTAAFAELQMLYPTLEPGLGRSQWIQAGFQLMALVVSILLAIISGSFCGLILKFKIFDPLRLSEMVDDSEIWALPKSLTEDEEADIRETLEKLGKILANRKELIHNTIIKDQLKGLEACLKA